MVIRSSGGFALPNPPPPALPVAGSRPLGGASDQGAGGKIARRVFGVQAHLDGMAARPDVGLAQPQRLAPGNAQHFGHQINAGDHFGHRVFHLDAGVHLDEIEPVGGIVVKIFHRVGAGTAGRPGQRHG